MIQKHVLKYNITNNYFDALQNRKYVIKNQYIQTNTFYFTDRINIF